MIRSISSISTTAASMASQRAGVTARARVLAFGLAGAMLALTGCAAELDTSDPLDDRESDRGVIEQKLAVATFEDRLDSALALSTQPGSEGKTDDTIELIGHADSYSEAALLAQVAAGGRTATPPSSVPVELSSNPRHPDYAFEGYQKTPDERVSAALAAIRDARNATLDAMSDTAFQAYADAEEQAHQTRRRTLAAKLGRTFDARDDLYVVVLNDGQIWRRKKPSGYVPSTVLEGEPGGGSSATLAAVHIEELGEHVGGDAMMAGEPSESGVMAALIGGDGRSLRSAHNGYNLASSVWQPKGALLRSTSSTDAVPLDVNCSGTKISQRLVVTAGHCLFKDGGWSDNKRFVMSADGIDAYMNGSDPSPFGYKTSWTRGVRGPWFDHEWDNYDFGLFVLYDNASSCTQYWHGWTNKSGLLNDTIHLYGYPGETRSCDPASPHEDKYCYGSMYGMGGTVTYAGSYRIHYGIDTQPGQSGSGVYEIIDGKRKVVAVHRGEWSGSANDGVHINNANANMINDTKADYPANACN